MTFEDWWEELKSLAKQQDLLWLLSNNPIDHREGYEDGNTAEDELDEMKYAALS